jgi:nitrate reductase gamma subunit
MSGYLNTLVFGYFPYLCAAVFLIGSLVRFEREQYTWRSGSSQILRKRQLFWGSNLFHVGILLLFVGHFFGLLTPKSVYEALGLSSEAKQVMAIVAGGIFGATCFVGLTMLLHRRLFDPRIRRTSSAGDILILLLLWAQLVLGLATLPFSWAHREGGLVMLKLSAWAQDLVFLRAGAADHVIDVHWIYRLHIVLGVTLFLVFPFTRLVHIWSAPIWFLGRKGYQIVRTRRLAGR